MVLVYIIVAVVGIVGFVVADHFFDIKSKLSGGLKGSWSGRGRSSHGDKREKELEYWKNLLIGDAASEKEAKGWLADFYNKISGEKAGAEKEIEAGDVKKLRARLAKLYNAALTAQNAADKFLLPMFGASRKVGKELDSILKEESTDEGVLKKAMGNFETCQKNLLNAEENLAKIEVAGIGALARIEHYDEKFARHSASKNAYKKIHGRLNELHSAYHSKRNRINELKSLTSNSGSNASQEERENYLEENAAKLAAWGEELEKLEAGIENNLTEFRDSKSDLEARRKELESQVRELNAFRESLKKDIIDVSEAEKAAIFQHRAAVEEFEIENRKLLKKFEQANKDLKVLSKHMKSAKKVYKQIKFGDAMVQLNVFFGLNRLPRFSGKWFKRKRGAAWNVAMNPVWSLYKEDPSAAWRIKAWQSVVNRFHLGPVYILKVLRWALPKSYKKKGKRVSAYDQWLLGQEFIEAYMKVEEDYRGFLEFDLIKTHAICTRECKQAMRDSFIEFEKSIEKDIKKGAHEKADNDVKEKKYQWMDNDYAWKLSDPVGKTVHRCWKRLHTELVGFYGENKDEITKLEEDWNTELYRTQEKYSNAKKRLLSIKRDIKKADEEYREAKTKFEMAKQREDLAEEDYKKEENRRTIEESENRMADSIKDLYAALKLKNRASEMHWHEEEMRLGYLQDIMKASLAGDNKDNSMLKRIIDELKAEIVRNKRYARAFGSPQGSMTKWLDNWSAVTANLKGMSHKKQCETVRAWMATKQLDGSYVDGFVNNTSIAKNCLEEGKGGAMQNGLYLWNSNRKLVMYFEHLADVIEELASKYKEVKDIFEQLSFDEKSMMISAKLGVGLKEPEEFDEAAYEKELPGSEAIEDPAVEAAEEELEEDSEFIETEEEVAEESEEELFEEDAGEEEGESGEEDWTDSEELEEGEEPGEAEGELVEDSGEDAADGEEKGKNWLATEPERDEGGGVLDTNILRTVRDGEE